jgi:hypothetical protein
LEELKKLYEDGKSKWLEGRHLDALSTYRSIIEKGHGYCGANMNAAVILTNLGRYEEAETHFREAFATCPEDRELLFNYSLHLMSKGNMKQGLKLYENRSWNIRPPGTEWDGKKCGTLLVVPEQGNGDLIQFARFLPLARKRCRKLIVMCFAPLVRLFSNAGFADEVIEFNPGDEFVEAEDGSSGEVPYDRFVRIMSIPTLLGIDRIRPAQYLKSDPTLVDEWANKSSTKKTKVGLCWRGGKKKTEDGAAIDMRRSVSIEVVRPLLSTEGVEFYSLQKDAEESDERLVDLMDESKDFADTAALISNLDLVITVDTAVAHVAAAMGKPTWVLNRLDSCWRWGHVRNDTIWYKNVRLFRQKNMMDWTPVIEQVQCELKKLVDRKRRS